MNKSFSLISSLLVASSLVLGCSSSSDKSTGSAGNTGSDDSSAGSDDGSAGKGSSGGSGSSAAGDDGFSAAGETSTGGTSSDGGSSNGNGGTAGMAMPTNADCKTLETCCEDLTQGEQEACNHIAGLNYGPSCKSTYSLYKCDAVIAAGNQPKTAACTTNDQCILTVYVSAAQGSYCTSSGGVASETCPAAGVTGCCKLAANAEVCTYTGNDSPITEEDCMAENGTFSTKP